MKMLIFFLSIILSLNTWSQITAGGGPDGDGGPRDIPLTEFLVLHAKYDELLKISNKRWKICFNDSETNFKSFQEVYIHLVWNDLSFSVATQNCSLNNERSNSDIPCFFRDEDFRFKLKHFLNSKYIGSFLNYVEGKESTTNEFINYFKYKSTLGD